MNNNKVSHELDLGLLKFEIESLKISKKKTHGGRQGVFLSLFCAHQKHKREEIEIVLLEMCTTTSQVKEQRMQIYTMNRVQTSL